MKINLRYLQQIICIILINGITFFLRPMTRFVLSPKLMMLATTYILESVSYFLIFLATVFLITLFFRAAASEQSPLSLRELFQKKILLKVIAIRVLTDFLGTILGDMFLSVIPLYTIAIFGIETLCTCAIFYVIRRNITQEKNKKTRSKTIGILCAVAILIALAIFYAVHFKTSLDIHFQLAGKYVDYGFMNGLETSEFELELVVLIYNIVLWFALFLYWGLFATRTNEENPARARGVFLVRVFCLIFILPIVLGIKVLILPHGTISNVNTPGRTHGYISYAPGDKDFNCNYSTVRISRRVNYDFSETVYEKKHVEILYGNEVVLRFSPDIAKSEPYVMLDTPGERNTLSIDGLFTLMEIPSVDKAHRYDFDALAFVSNGKPIAMRMSEINSYPEKNEALLTILKHMIAEGHFEAFEYSYQYLLTHERDFILPYIQKYAEGNLTEEEWKMNSYIETEYIQGFAKGIVY